MSSARACSWSSSSPFLVCAASIVGLAASAWASAPIPIIVDNNNVEVQRKSSDGTTYTSQAQPWSGMRMGYQASFGSQTGGFGYGGINAILYFKLPTAPAGQGIASASMSLSLLKNSESAPVQPEFNIDLYALGFDQNDRPDIDGADSGYGVGGVPSATVTPAYFYVGPSQASTTITAVNPNNVPSAKIQEDILNTDDWAAAQVASDNQVLRGTTAAGNNALAGYIQGLYSDANFTAGHDFLVLRMNPDVEPTSTKTRRYQIPFAQTPTYDDGGVHTPTSTTATVPTLYVSFALLGDANSDGKIDGDDYALVDRGYAKSLSGAIPAGSTQWTDGDFNHDGSVTSADYLILDTAYSQAVGGAPASLLDERAAQFGEAYVQSLIASVPEPASLSVLGLGSLALLSRRRRRGGLRA